jgi:hypothetical protein
MLVKELLNNPKRWTKDTEFRDHAGRPILSEFSLFTASSFCLLGALKRCYGRERKDYDKAMSKIQGAIAASYPRLYGGVSYFNDHPAVDFQMIREILEKANV